MRVRPRITALGLLAFAASMPPGLRADAPTASQPASAPTARFAIDRAAALRAIERAKAFLRQIEPKVDPVKLRQQHSMKGAKFYVEYLNAWRNIFEISDEAGRQVVREYLRPIVARTDSEFYHKLGVAVDQRFNEDIISYLSACVIHKQFGFDTVRYDQEIVKILPRILAPQHMARRGIDNTMAIVFRLRELGHAGGPALCDIWKRRGCVTREHPDLTKFKLETYNGRIPVYDMTHEIFYLTELGRTPMQCVSPADLAYIRQMHSRLIPIFIGLKDHDALAELVMCLNYLKMTDLPEYPLAYSHLLESQNEDGSWGDHEHIAQHVKAILELNPRYLVDVGQYLHTTEVTLDAICYPLKPESNASTSQETER